MSLRTYLDVAWRDGKAPIDPSTLVIHIGRLFFVLLPNLLYLVVGLDFFNNAKTKSLAYGEVEVLC